MQKARGMAIFMLVQFFHKDLLNFPHFSMSFTVHFQKSEIPTIYEISTNLQFLLLQWFLDKHSVIRPNIEYPLKDSFPASIYKCIFLLDLGAT